jgi:hypothetical protein
VDGLRPAAYAAKGIARLLGVRLATRAILPEPARDIDSRLMRQHSLRVLRAWLWPTRHLESLAGWVQVILGAAALFVSASIAGAVGGLLASAKVGGWTAAVALLVLGLFLALAALWKELPNPELELGMPEQTGVQLPIEGADGEPLGQGIYFHVEARNKSKHPLSVVGDLIGVEMLEPVGGGYKKMEAFGVPMTPLPLKWANEKPDVREVELGADIPRKLDLISREEMNPGFAILMTTEHHQKGMPATLYAGTYQLMVQVRAEGCRPANGAFNVIVGGPGWNALEVSQVKSNGKGAPSGPQVDNRL